MSKILCGLDLEAVIACSYRLSEPDKEMADEMLQAVIAHWSMLKNTSVDSLRETFLKREGRLCYTEHNWQLTVQEQAYDMLLDHLPWSISMIRLPWMPYLLQVKWRL